MLEQYKKTFTQIQLLDRGRHHRCPGMDSLVAAGCSLLRDDAGGRALGDVESVSKRGFGAATCSPSTQIGGDDLSRSTFSKRQKR